MKKFLSLVLALVMTMSLVTVSAGAKDFNDSDDLSGEQYEEAVNVMSEMGIIDGYAGGNFQPQGTLTRGAAAKIIACMMLGKTTAEALGTSAAPFKDVPAGSTFAGYIAYCVESGLIDGYADGTFRPQNTLTGFAFLKMLLTALGYDSAIEGYTGTNWTVNVAGRATQIGLTDGNEDFVGSRAATREEACLYAVNALKTTLVEYESKGTNVTVNGATVAIGASKPTYVTSSIAGAATSIDDTRDNYSGDYTVEFAERYQPDLELDPDTDAFGRPARTWRWDGHDIGTYVDYSLMVEEYSSKVTGEELYELLGRNTINDYDLTVYVDGGEVAMAKSEMVRSNGDGIETSTTIYGNAGPNALTGNGVLTQVFVDTDAGEITIVVINTFLAVVNSDYNANRETVSLQVYFDVTGTPKTVDVEDVPGIEDLKEDDVVLVNWAGVASTTAGKDVEIISDVPTVLTDVEVTRFSKDNDDDLSHNGVTADRVTEITTGGVDYSNNKNAWYDDKTLGDYDGQLLTDKTYNVYVDQYGYFIGAELYSGEDNYVFISAADVSNSSLGYRTGTAMAVFPDGRAETIDVDVKDTNTNITRVAAANATVASDSNYAPWSDGTKGIQRWFTYTVSDDVYTLTPVNRYIADVAQTAGEEITIKCDNLSLTTNSSSADVQTGRYAYGNDNSVYITVSMVRASKGNNVVDEVTGVFTGAQDVRITYENNTAPEAGWIVAVYDEDYEIIAAVVNGDAEGAIDNYAYILSGANSEGRDSDGYYYWTFDAILNGEIQELTIRDRYSNTVTALRPDVVQELIFDADGYVRTVKDIPNSNAAARPSGVTTLPTIAGGNDVFDESDYSNASTVTSNFDVYDLYVYGSYAQNGDDIYLDGRTLHYRDDVDAHGLGIASDAKAVLSQVVDGKRTETEYGTVREAFTALADTDNAAGKQSRVRVVAVLNSDGVADWVFFYDYTPVGRGNDPTYDENGNVASVSFNESTNNVQFKDAAGNGVQSTFTLWQLRDNGYVEVGIYTTAANGVVKLPTLSGNTYRVTCGNFVGEFTDSVA